MVRSRSSFCGSPGLSVRPKSAISKLRQRDQSTEGSNSCGPPTTAGASVVVGAKKRKVKSLEKERIVFKCQMVEWILYTAVFTYS